MFFDTILLQTQHRGHFGKAWLAATIGVKKISKDKLLEVDICKLCDHQLIYIISQSTSPKKRFSLRLSVLLLNGTLRIFKYQVINFEGEVITALRVIHIPESSRSLPGRISRSRSESTSPLTPIAKVKGRKSIKYVETPVSQIPQELPIPRVSEHDPLPEVEDILALQPTRDLITLKEEIPRQPIIDQDTFDAPGDFTIDELRELGMVPQLHIPAQPVSPISPVIPSTSLIVQAHVHAEKDASPSKKKRVSKKADDVQIQQVPAVEQEASIQTTAAVLPTLGAREAPDILQIDEQPVVAAQASKTLGRPVLKELNKDEINKRSERRGSPEEKRERKEQPKKVKPRGNQHVVFTIRVRRPFFRINRYNESESCFSNKHPGFVTKNKNQVNCSVQTFIMSDEDARFEENLHPRTSSLGSSSTDSKLTPRGRSTLEGDIIRGQGQDSLAGTSEDLLARRRTSLMESQVSGHPGTLLPMEIENVLESRKPSIEPIIAPQILETPVVHILPPAIEGIRTSELDQVSSMQIPEIPVEQILSPIEGIRTGQLDQVSLPIHSTPTEFPIQLTPQREQVQKSTPETDDYKERQQKIIELVCNWNFGSQILTIEDVAEKPLNRLTIARAFHDLLVLSASKYVSLFSYDDSNELKYIAKGPKLL